MHRASRHLAVLAAFAIAACATAQGSSKFRQGERAHDAGDLEAAQAAYRDAVKSDPKNPQYQSALDKVSAEIAERYANEAKAKEKANDWTGASESWARAAAANPADADLKARKGLSALKAQNLGPDEWYEGVKKVADEVPGNAIASKALAGARAKACQYHVELGDKYVESNEGKKALSSYDRAQQIDAAAPGLDKARYRRATALALMQDADDKLAAGDAIAATELYQKAFETEPLPEIKAKLAKAKAKGSAVGGKLEQARALAAKGKNAEALKLYEGLAGGKGVPASVESEVKQVRAAAAKDEADRALAAAKSGDLAKAQRSLAEALRFGTLEKPQAEVVKAALAELQDGRPGKGLRTLEGSGVAASDPIYVATQALAVATAKKSVEKAKSISKKDSAAALALLSDLGPFEDELPAIKDLRKELRAGSFQELLDEALKAAKAGKDEEAGMLLVAALSASNAPEKLRDAAGEAAEALKAGRYGDAESGFQRALAVEPKSKLAQRGVDIARLRKKEGESKALDIVKSGKGDVAKAVDVLARALAAEPGNLAAKQGADALVGRAESAPKTTSDADLAALLAGAAKLSEAPVAAKSATEEGAAALGKGDHASAEASFTKALEAAPSLRPAKLGKELAKARMLAALKSGAKRAADGDEGAAKALAELLKKDPNDAEAKAALQAMLDKAKAAADKGDEAAAARQLELAAVATSPLPGVKLALDNGSKALAAGKMEEAEKAYSDALDLEAESPVAKVGFEIAKAARVKALSAAVADAKKGGGVEQAREALKRSLAMNPDGPEARKAFGDLIDEAKAQGEAGNDRQAAQLLDAANVVSKPETVRSAIGEATKLLADGKHADAEAAYDKVLGGGDSKVAGAGKEIAHKRRLQVLKEGALELKKGGDIDRGAKATAELLELDPTSADAKAAIDGAMREAERLAAGGDDKGAARLIRAAARAAKEGKDLEAGIIRFESGKYDDAAKELEKSSSELARRAAALVRARKLGTLKAGLSGDDRAAAESIKALLQADPNNKDAQAAFAKLLEKAKAAAAKGDLKGAGDALQSATIASAAPEQLAAALDAASTKLGEKRLAEAEKGYTEALELSKESKVAKTGLELAKKERLTAEKAAAAALAKGGDPTEHAKILASSLIVDPQSKTVAEVLKNLLVRAKKAAAKPDDAEAAQVLDSAAVLENGGAELIAAIAKADAELAKGNFQEAEALYVAALGGKGDDEAKVAVKSQVATTGVEIARMRRVMVLKGELEAAKKDGDVLRQSSAVQKVLELEKNDKAALDLSKKLKVQVTDSRAASAKREKEFGKLGVAWVYLKRAVELDPANAKNKAELGELEAALKKQLDLVILVDKVARKPEVPQSACAAIEAPMREAAIEEGAKRKDLGAYVLPKDWTDLVDAGDKQAPAVGGRLELLIVKCEHGSAVGKATIDWRLAVPASEGTTVTKGTISTDIPSGLIPKDEQDGDGKNAKKVLARRAGKTVIDKLSDEKAAVELWLLTLAEHAIAKKDTAAAADAYARLVLKRPSSVEPARMAAVEKYLETELK